jgi:hypothetical protein
MHDVIATSICIVVMAAAGWWLKASAPNSIGLSLDVPPRKDEARSVTSEEAAVDSWVLLLAKNIYYIASAQKHRQLHTTGCSS